MEIVPPVRCGSDVAELLAVLESAPLAMILIETDTPEFLVSFIRDDGCWMRVAVGCEACLIAIIQALSPERVTVH